MTKKLLAGLNPEQARAVTQTEGPVLVLAGAGTGKTRVITVRIAHLLSKKVSPKNILAMTFTNKAAREMRERVASLIGKKKAEDLTVGTFHAFCARALREHHEAAGLPKGFTICDAADQLTAVKGALRELRIPEAHLHPRVAQSRISLLKNRLVTPEGFLEQADGDQDELLGRVYRRYVEALRRSRSLDFDDLLLELVRVLRDDAKVRGAFRKKYRYVLVDEYQDTNGPQYEIVHLIAEGHRNLCVVGDDDQSIYGWRGADVSKILGFENDFPGAVVVRLETNYRSTRPILRAANKVIANNPNRHEKALKSHFGDGDVVRAREVEDEQTEADKIVREIVYKNTTEGVPLGDYAILFRTSIQPRVFETELRARNVPYVLVGGPSFFDRKEVRDVLAYVRLIENPSDEASFLRVVNSPPRGIGKASLDRALEFAAEQGISIAEAFDRGAEIEKLKPAAAEAAQAFLRLVRTLGKEQPGANLVRFVERVIEAVSYRTEVERAYPDEREAQQRWSAVDEILNMAENHVRRAKKPSLGSFLEELALNANDDKTDSDEKNRGAVTLMTLHAAKGLEFPRVFLVGCEEGILPHARAVEEDTVEEERRLMYVGITRARRHLTVSWATSRSRYGHRLPSYPSRFVFEMKGERPPERWIAWGMQPSVKDVKKKRGKKKKAARRARR